MDDPTLNHARRIAAQLHVAICNATALVHDTVAAAIREAVAAEREACARIAEAEAAGEDKSRQSFEDDPGYREAYAEADGAYEAAASIARTIRARGTP